MSYESALVAAGCEIIEFRHFGSYQGDWYAHVKFNGETGIVSGSYGSCSGCDSFEAEFGWDDENKADYLDKLKSFGETYLPVLPVEHYIAGVEKSLVNGYDWNDEKETLQWLKSISEKGA